MKVVILAGGLGTRLAEETNQRPKPLIEIGGMPLLWHIMRIYSFYGINDFIICCGYKGNMIKEYFSNHSLSRSDTTFHLQLNKVKINEKFVEPCTVTLVDTGLETMTGGRLKKVKKFVQNETFCLTYGDDLKNVNITELIKFHYKKKRIATVTAVHLPNRFGILYLRNDKVFKFKEKSTAGGSWINGWRKSKG
jgi:glucose-1-phosphate cytidylyltransferase